MRKEGESNRDGEVLFLLLLFGIFVLSALSVTLMGARTYEKIKENMDVNYTRRTSAAYLTEKIRQHDESGRIYLKNIEGKEVLVLQKEVGGKDCATYIYEEEHYIRELFTGEGQIPNLSYGEKIMKVGGFSLKKEDRIYRLEIEDEEGNVFVSYICPRTEGQGKE